MLEDVEKTSFGFNNNGTLDEGQPKRVPTYSHSKFSLADSVAAITIAVLATTVLITLICIVRLLRKRRTQRQGQQMNRTPTVYTSTLGASVMAFHNLQIHMQNDSDASWEPVQVHQEPERPPTSAITDPRPSTSHTDDNEIPIISMVSIHNDIQRQQNHINAGYVHDTTDDEAT